MGGRIIFERLSCSSPASASPSSLSSSPASSGKDHENEKDTENVFLRINVNDGIVALPGCDSGPGRSCPLQSFLEIVRKRGEEVGNFGSVCGLPPDAADRITFLHQ